MCIILFKKKKRGKKMGVGLLLSLSGIAIFTLGFFIGSYYKAGACKKIAQKILENMDIQIELMNQEKGTQPDKAG